MDKNEYLQELEAVKKDLQTEIQKEASKQIDEKVKAVEIKATDETKSAIVDIKKSWEEYKVQKDEADKKNQEALDKLILESQKPALPVKQDEKKTFNQILTDGITKNAERIQGFHKGDPEIKIDLLPEFKGEKTRDGKFIREVKTVGDMSITANFSAAPALYQDVRPLIVSPYNRIWLSDLLPSGSSNSHQIIYPKENGGEGAAALWDDPTEDKPQMDFDLTTQVGYFKWIAGIVIVDREMLDDIPFMTSYIQNKMLISLKTAENAFILNGAGGAQPVTGLLDAATAYSGTYTKPVERVIDAAWGQIIEDTDEFYSPTTIIMRPRAAVAIGLNTADGSGEYDLPPGSVTFANGRLQIGGLDLAVTTGITANTFIAMDKAATMFVRRMVPELRVFEDSILAKRNKLMFRIEERATLAIFNNAAIVADTLDATGS